jgi:hypothetical protein
MSASPESLASSQSLANATQAIIGSVQPTGETTKRTIGETITPTSDEPVIKVYKYTSLTVSNPNTNSSASLKKVNDNIADDDNNACDDSDNDIDTNTDGDIKTVLFQHHQNPNKGVNDDVDNINAYISQDSQSVSLLKNDIANISDFDNNIDIDNSDSLNIFKDETNYCPKIDSDFYEHCNHAFQYDSQSKSDSQCCGCGQSAPGNQQCLSSVFSYPENPFYKHTCQKCSF